jgi:AraC-like DNA-binding protein
MRYHVHPAPHDLAHVVRFFWTVESEATGDVPHRLTAETCPNLVFTVQGAFTEADGRAAPRAHLAGALQARADMMAHGPFRLIGVYLWPWSTEVLFGQAAEACIGRFMDLRTLAPDLAQLCSTWPECDADVEHSLATLTFGLRRLVDPSRVPAEAMQHVVHEMLGVQVERSIDDHAVHCGLARRQFERRFKECTGFPPALFQRIARFQRTYRMLEDGTATSLTDIALAGGYFDQSHFIREFKRFSGLNPRDYFVKGPDKVDNFVRLASAPRS